MINMTWISIGFSILLVSIGGFLLIQSNNNNFDCLSVDGSNQCIPHYNLAVVIFCIGATMEMLVEPMYVTSQYAMNVSMAVKSESIATFVRCALTYVFVVYGNFFPNVEGNC